MIKLFFLRRLLAFAYVADGVLIFFGGSSICALKVARVIARHRYLNDGIKIGS
jgi:hypothetical protein